MTRLSLLENRAGICAAGLSAYIFWLIATAPATLADAGLRQASDGRLGLSDARGTLWSGTGQFDISSADRRAVIGKNVSWRFRPWSLATGRPSWEIAMSGSSEPFPVSVTPSGVEIAGARIDLPATVIGITVPRLSPLELRGDVTLRVSRAALSRSGLSGEISMQWRSASSALAVVAPLGDYELRLAGDNVAGRASLHTLRGPLQLDGSGSWSAGNAPVFQATAVVPAPLRQALAPLMRLIGIERGNGRFDLRLERRF